MGSWATIALAAVLLTGGAVAPAAVAAPSAAGSPAEVVPTMIVLDASGSMLESDAPGPRIDAAKDAATALVNGFPAGAHVGLMVYGTGTGSADSEKDAGCQDVRTLVPVGEVDAAAMTAQIAGIQASGYTPIGRALSDAAAALPGGAGAIVLVSDGIDTCAPPDPCEVARGLASSGVELTVHTVGFRVDDAARAQLACIADATGGTYADAQDDGQLAEALRVKVDYALTGYETRGTPIAGSLTADGNPPAIGPGQWLDEFRAEDLSAVATGGEESFLHYRLEVPEGYRPHVTASLIPTAASAPVPDLYSGVSVSLTGAAGADCGMTRDAVGAAEETAFPPTAALTSECDGPLILAVRRDGTALTDRDLPVEILVRLEPPVDAAGLPSPGARPGPAAPVPDAATATPLAGGGSFNTAADIFPGQTYRSQIGTSEVKFFKVRLDWGQQLSYTVTQDRRLDGGDRMNVIGPQVRSPLRAALPMAEGSSQNLVWMTESDPSFRTLSRSTPEPVRFGSTDYALPGEYYIVLADRSGAREFVLDSFLIEVTVSGGPESGPRPLIDTPSPASSPQATTEPDASHVGGSGAVGPVALVVGGGILLVGAAIVGAVLLRRRRSL
ncbi:VWA domain-containing protein [Microbacterium flavum]